MSAARRAVAFLTPLGGAAPPSAGALAWFPVVGGALGALLGLLWWGMAHAWPLSVVAAVVVAADLALTGLLHLDGLVDSADGLLGHLPRARRLEVMREPTVGAFGIAAAGAFLLLRWAAIAALRPSVLLLAGLWAASRGAMAVTATMLPYARADHGGGLASAFIAAPPGSADAPRPSRRLAGPGARGGAVGLLVAVGCLLAWDPVPGAVALAGGLVAAAAVVWLAVRRIGGFTGDVLGAAGVVLETVGLVIASARW